MKKLALSLVFISSTLSFAGPVIEMNKAFNYMSGIMPYVHDKEAFENKANEKKISKGLSDLSSSLKESRHHKLIQHDLFAPSYALINQGLKESTQAFNQGKKDFALWHLRQTLSVCLDCHSRLPTDHTSSFQDGKTMIDKNQWKTPYELGVAYLIVRRYVDAKTSFTRSLQDKIILKDQKTIHQPLEQILFIQTKILKDPGGMIAIIDDYLKKNNLPPHMNKIIKEWKKDLSSWESEKALSQGMKDEKELKAFVKRRLSFLEKKSFNETSQIDLLLSSGVLSNYFFENQSSPSLPELSLWLGRIEKRLKREHFLTSGDLYLKQCIKKYPSHPAAKKCFEEYKESLEFDFSGSSGTNIPKELKKELDELEKRLK